MFSSRGNSRKLQMANRAHKNTPDGHIQQTNTTNLVDAGIYNMKWKVKQQALILGYLKQINPVSFRVTTAYKKIGSITSMKKHKMYNPWHQYDPRCETTLNYVRFQFTSKNTKSKA